MSAQNTNKQNISHISHDRPAHTSSVSEEPKFGFFESVMRLFREGYTMPHIYRALMDTVILLVLIASVSTLMAMGSISEHIGAVLLALLMGFVLGKIR